MKKLLILSLIPLFYSHPSAAQQFGTTEQIEMVVTTAESFLGTSYKWGGNGYAGIDCSGLTYRSFKAAGFEIPRNSRLQALHDMGLNIPENNLQRGDLVFFNDGRSKKISHVGIITTAQSGNITFIHSSGKKGVDYDYLKDWEHRYVAARRIVSTEFSPEPEVHLSLNELKTKIFEQRSYPQTPQLTRGGGTTSTEYQGNYPRASNEYLSLSDIRHLSPCEIKIMKNEIYARHGYEFHLNQWMVDYFQSLAWYRKIPKVSFSAEYIFFKYLSEVEKHNVELLLKYEGDCP